MFVTANGVEIKGESSVHSEGREDSIEVVELTHEVLSPTDGASGMRSGHREHRPLVVVARVDRATPLLYKAWSNNEDCEVEIRFWRPDPGGTGREQHYFTIEMTGVNVASVKMHFPNAVRAGTASDPEQVEYGFQYDEIRWEIVGRGIEHSDRWRPDMM